MERSGPRDGALDRPLLRQRPRVIGAVVRSHTSDHLILFIYYIILWYLSAMSPSASHRLKAFTLTELLIALVIVGILVYLALPDYSQVVANAKATEAKLQLEHLYSLETTHYYERTTYTADLQELGFQQQKLVSAGGNANYQVEVVSASPNWWKETVTR